MDNYIPSEIEGLIAATSMPESIYVIYTDRSGPTKWTSSRAEAMYLSIKVLNISLLNLYDKRRRSNN